MAIAQTTLTVPTSGQGLTEITDRVRSAAHLDKWHCGWVHVFCRHTSCSLMLMENADPSARRDLEAWLNRLVPERDPHFTHTIEGDDDMPSHIKMALTRSGEQIPFADGDLLLGTWQGLFLWEHRRAAHARSLIVTVQGE